MNRLDVRYSEHFHAREFACRCYGKNVSCPGLPAVGVSGELVKLLEEIRTHFGAPVHILSGYRCPDHNAAVGGARDSRHMKGDAADIVVRGVSPEEVWKFASIIVGEDGGVGKYSSFTHVDARGYRARWEG